MGGPLTTRGGSRSLEPPRTTTCAYDSSTG